MDRRRKCQSILAHFALTQRSYTSPAVGKVSAGVIKYINEYLNDSKRRKLMLDQIATCMGKYMYSIAGYGRLG
jgi:hypothetical protein